MLKFDQQLMRSDYATIRRSMPSCDWDKFATLIAAHHQDIDAEFRKPESERDLSLGDGAEFARSGLLKLPFTMSAEWAASIRDHLTPLPILTGHNYLTKDQEQRSLADVQRDSSMAAYQLDQIVCAPYLVDVLNYAPLIDFVERRMGCVPTLYSAHAWWSFPATEPHGFNAQYFHRDTDDWRFFALFIYLTDVDEESGPHQLIKGSHSLDGMTRLIDDARSRGRNVEGFDIRDSFLNHRGAEFSSRCEHLFAEHVANVTGPAGTMFLANTLAMHRGLVPKRDPRLILWARFGLGSNTNSVDHGGKPVARSRVTTHLADTPRNRYINRMILSFDE